MNSLDPSAGVIPRGEQRDLEQPLQNCSEALDGELSRIPFAVPSSEDLKLLLAAAASNPRDLLLIRMLYATGLRSGEIVTVRFSDVCAGEQRLFVRSGKGDADRYVLLDRETLTLLQAHEASTNSGGGRVFPIDDNDVRAHLHVYLVRTGLYAKYDAQGLRFSTHSLRHAFATHSYENGMDMYTVRALLGHQYLQTTAIYIESARRDWRAAYDAAHELVSPGGVRARSLREVDDEEEPGPAEPGGMQDELDAEFAGELAGSPPGLNRLPLVPTREIVANMLALHESCSFEAFVLRFLYASAARQAECRGLSQDDFSASRGTIRLGPSARPREVCLDAGTVALLPGHLTRLGACQPAEICGILENAAAKVGLLPQYEATSRQFSPHALRHACATHCYENGMDLWALHRFLGNRYVSTTELYDRCAARLFQRDYLASHEFTR